MRRLIFIFFTLTLLMCLSGQVLAANDTNTTVAATPPIPVTTASASTQAVAPQGISGFDQFLNFAIPALLIVVFISFIYSKFKEPLTDFYHWIMVLFGAAKDKINESGQNSVAYTKEIIYEP